MFHKVFALLVFIKITDCYKIIDDNGIEKTEAAADIVGNVYEDKLNISMLHLNGIQDSSNQRIAKDEIIKTNYKTIRNEELEKLTQAISEVCKVKYKPCHGQDDEMNHFKDTSPCISCSCNPVLCQIAGNCCPDVDPLSIDEEDDNIVLPVCMQMFNFIPKHKPSKEQEKHSEDRKDVNEKNMNMYNTEQQMSDTKTRNAEHSELVKTTSDSADANRITKDELDTDEKKSTTLSMDSKLLPSTHSNRSNKSSEHYKETKIINNFTDSILPRSVGIAEDTDNSLKDKSDNEQTSSDKEYNDVDFTESITDLKEKQTTKYYNNPKDNSTPAQNDFHEDEFIIGNDEVETQHENIYIKDNTTLINKTISTYLEKDRDDKEVYDSQIPHRKNSSHGGHLPGHISDHVAKNEAKNQTVKSVKHYDTIQNHTKTDLEFPKFLVINRCPKDFYDEEIINKCEGRNSSQLLDYIPGSQNVGQLVYKNKWCAKCQNVSLGTFWRLATNCMHFYQYYNLPADLEQFLKLYQNCTAYTVPPQGMMDSFLRCSEKPSIAEESVIVDKCNMTGNWESNDAVILELCESKSYLPAYQDTVETSGNVYKNIFCFTCNTRNNSIASVYGKQRSSDNPVSELGNKKIYMEVNIASETNFALAKTGEDFMTCSSGYVPDPYHNGCIPFQCPVYQTQVATMCLDKDSLTIGLVITATLSVTFHEGPVKLENTDTEVINYGHYLNSVIDNMLQFRFNRCNITFVRILANYTETSTQQVERLYMEYKITNTKPCSVKKIVNTFDKIVSTNVTATVYSDSKNMMGTLHQVTKNSKMISIGMEFSSVHNTHINKTVISSPMSYEIKMHEAFNCPSVLLNLTYYMQLVANKSLLPLAPSRLETIYTKRTGMVPISYSSYMSKWYADNFRQHRVSDDLYASTNLNFLSTLISMASIIMVLITYFLFPDLRFVPGKVFMMLCFNLFIAQGLITFGSGLEEHYGWCQFIGMLIHFFWLATIFSMNSNLILMFSNIMNPLDVSSRVTIHSRSNYTVYRYIIYSYSMSIACVLINVTLSHVLFGDDHYGYGGHLCYINTPIMRVATFTLPLITVLLVNFGMFMFIICKVTKAMYNRYCFVFKSTFHIVLKLSTITGMFWLFGFLYEGTGIRIFEYLFIILNAGQGFFLMTSFLMNKRVLQLYQAKISTYWAKRDSITESNVLS